MDRRTVLATAALSLPILSISGCTAAAPTNNSSASTADAESDTGSRTDSNETTDETTDDETVTDTEPIELEVYNETSSDVTATAVLIRGSSTVLEEEFEIAPDGSLSTDTGITETGQYELTVAVTGGREKTWSFDIEAYDLRAGSGMSVIIELDELEWLIEE